MNRYAIVEDTPEEAKALEEGLRRFYGDLPYHVHHFSHPLTFLEEWKGDYDVIFLDIEMPAMDGISLAKRIREKDAEVILVFVTHLGQMAVEGYSVEALDFVVKPIQYPLFENTMRRVAGKLEKKSGDTYKIQIKNGVRAVNVKDILYVEVFQHRLIYHLTNGEALENWNSLAEAEKALGPKGFGRCNSCYLVNYSHIRAIQRDYVLVGEDELKISRAKKAEFLDGFARRISL